MSASADEKGQLCARQYCGQTKWQHEVNKIPHDFVAPEPQQTPTEARIEEGVQLNATRRKSSGALKRARIEAYGSQRYADALRVALRDEEIFFSWIDDNFAEMCAAIRRTPALSPNASEVATAPLTDAEIASWAETINKYAPGWIHADGSSVEVQRAEAIAFSQRVVATVADLHRQVEELVGLLRRAFPHVANSSIEDAGLLPAITAALVKYGEASR